jgi:glycosyltransferase involved in cell wall biosynthesis
MLERPYRLLLTFTHPVQYTSPFLREMGTRSTFEITAAYCSLQGAEMGHDPGFGVDVAWDIPLLEGYPWVQVRNASPRPGLTHFFGLLNFELWTMVRDGKYDAILSYTGYSNATFWIVAIACKFYRVPLLFGTDATGLKPRDGRRWKQLIKKLLLPAIFKFANAVVIPSEAGRRFILSLGIPDDKIFLTPFAVDNDWWRRRAAEVDRDAIRKKWQVPVKSRVILFCAKLQPWKRPADLLRAFAKSGVSDTYLVFVGDGALRSSLEAEAKARDIYHKVRFLGFHNQTSLPAVYRSADLMVLPSEYDPCPVVVCEAMLCGCPVAISDEIRGRFDLVEHGITGFIFHCGDTDALAGIISDSLRQSTLLADLGRAASARMDSWTPSANVDGVARAVESVIGRRVRQDS